MRMSDSYGILQKCHSQYFFFLQGFSSSVPPRLSPLTPSGRSSPTWPRAKQGWCRSETPCATFSGSSRRSRGSAVAETDLGLDLDLRRPRRHGRRHIHPQVTITRQRCRPRRRVQQRRQERMQEWHRDAPGRIRLSGVRGGEEAEGGGVGGAATEGVAGSGVGNGGESPLRRSSNTRTLVVMMVVRVVKLVVMLRQRGSPLPKPMVR